MLYGGYVNLMSRVKDIRLKVIPSKIATDFVKKHHYSGKVDPRSNLHLGCFLDDVLHGVLQYGISIAKKKVIGLVKGTKWNEFIELNRMAFDKMMPKNSASRVLSISFKLIKKNAPHIKWILSYADATQSGDGTIYRASGFILTQINENKSIVRMPNGDVICKIVLEPSFGGGAKGGVKKKQGKIGKYDGWTSNKYIKYVGGEFLKGFQLRYIYFLHPEERKNLTVPEIPFSKIKEMGVSMYLGKKKCDVGVKRSTASFQDVGGGAIPTTSLHLNYA